MFTLFKIVGFVVVVAVLYVGGKKLWKSIEEPIKNEF